MSKSNMKSFSEMSESQQFHEIPQTFQQAQAKTSSSQYLSPQYNISRDEQSYEYIQYVRKKAKQQLNHYLKLLIIKTILFGITFGILVLAVLYDKLFFSTHYYMRTREYQLGQLGFELRKTKLTNMPNYQFKSGQDFNIQSVKGNGNWDAQRSFDQNSYHLINPETKKDKYDLEGYIVEQLMLKDFPQDIKMDEYSLAAHLLQVTHNIDFNGRLTVQKTKYQKFDSDMQEKKKRIQKILRIQKQRYQQKYQISKYINNQLPFCLIVPSYNNVQSRLYLRNLDSIFMQEYDNYHVVYIDDASPDKTGQFVKKYIKEKNIPEEKIKVIINEKNVLALANLYTGITQHCKSGEIVMLLDGDDAFLGRQVMPLFNAVYQKNRAGLVYSRYFVVASNDRGGIGGSSRQIPPEYLQYGNFRKQKAFFTSHLLTFYADLFWKVKPQDLKYDNGTFFKFAYDVAIVTPIIEMLGTKLAFIQETTYEYRFDTGINDPGWGQIEVDNIVFNKRMYERLTEFPFIDKFYDDLEAKQKVSKI